MHARTDFATLRRPRSPNTFLLAPDGLCRNASPDIVAPAFPVSPAELRQEFLRIALAAPRVSHVLADERALYDDFIVRTPVLGFPDLVSAVFAGGGAASTLAVYSRSVYGWSDLGVNRGRILGWLALLGKRVTPVKR